MRQLRAFIAWQRQLSLKFDSLLPREYQIDGNRDFLDHFALERIGAGLRVCDVGGGKQPYLSSKLKRENGNFVVGLDVDAGELSRAPIGCYDETICADITEYLGQGDFDVVICQALLEHVPDTRGALRGISSLLRPNGLALVFVPSRNAAYARLNLLLPEGIKRWILYTIYPETRRSQGFLSYYDRCTPRDFRVISTLVGMRVEEERFYYRSGYFMFFTPLHIAWRFWLVTFRAVAGTQAAETFCMALRKVGGQPLSNGS